MRATVVAIAVGLLVASVVAAARGAESSSGNLELEAGRYTTFYGQSYDVTATVKTDHAVGVVLEADPHPYGDGWQEIGRGMTDPASQRYVVRHLPTASTRYRATSLETGYYTEVDVLVQLRKWRLDSCKRRVEFERRVPCSARLTVRAPDKYLGERVQFSVYNADSKLVARHTRKLRRLKGALMRARVSYRRKMYDITTVCLLGTRGDGFYHPEYRNKDRDCSFDIGLGQ